MGGVCVYVCCMEEAWEGGKAKKKKKKLKWGYLICRQLLDAADYT